MRELLTSSYAYRKSRALAAIRTRILLVERRCEQKERYVAPCGRLDFPCGDSETDHPNFSDGIGEAKGQSAVEPCVEVLCQDRRNSSFVRAGRIRTAPIKIFTRLSVVPIRPSGLATGKMSGKA